MKFTGTPREVGMQILAWAGPLRADSETIVVTLEEERNQKHLSELWLRWVKSGTAPSDLDEIVRKHLEDCDGSVDCSGRLEAAKPFERGELLKLFSSGEALDLMNRRS